MSQTPIAYAYKPAAWRRTVLIGTKGISFADEALYQASSEVEFGSFYQRWNGYGTYQPC